MRKLLAVILALAMCVALFGCGKTEPAETTAPATTAAPVVETTVATEPKEDVVILYTNDVHTYIDGPLSYDVLAGLKDSLKAVYGNVLLVDAGDAVQGTAFGSMDKGETIVKLMNAAGYDLATLGNHEFDYGMDGAMNVINWAQFPYISCNFYHEKTVRRALPFWLPTKSSKLADRRLPSWASPPPNPSPSPPLLTSRMLRAITFTASPAVKTVRLCTLMCRLPLTLPRRRTPMW